VSFAALPDRIEVVDIELTFDTNTANMRTLREDIVARYGQPTSALFASNGDHWCEPIAKKCGLDLDPDGAKLIYSPSILYVLTLTNAWAKDQEIKRAIAAQFHAPTGNRQRALLGGR
jgi:hypothetical protein